MEFKRITLDDIETLNRFLSKQEYRSSIYTLGVLYLYEDFLKPKYCVIEDTLFINILNKHYLYPLGKSAKKLEDQFEEYILAPKLDGYYSFLIEDNFDYLYNYHDLLHLQGKKYQKIRNRINRFFATYKDFRYEIITPQNIKDVETILDEAETLTIEKKNELERNRLILKDYFLFPFIGGILYVNNHPVSFSFGEVIKDTLHIHVEKVNKHYLGAGDVQRQYFLEHFSQSDVQYINRQEDLGDPGLRFAKQSLRPCLLLHKYCLSKDKNYEQIINKIIYQE